MGKTKQDWIIELEDNLKNGFFVKKEKDINALLTAKILEKNDKCSANYYGYWVENVNSLNWVLKASIKADTIPNEFYYEILSEHMARDMGIESIHSYVTKFCNDINAYCILSQNYNLPDYYVITGREIIYDYLYHLEDTGKLPEQLGIINLDELTQINVNSLPLIHDALEYHFNYINVDYAYDEKKAASMTETIYKQLVERYIFSIITMQRDFHLRNWELRENIKKGVSLSPLYDMELSFNKKFYDSKYNSSMKASLNPNLSWIEDFKLFYNQSEENKMLFERMFYLINPDNITKYVSGIPGMPIDLAKDIIKNYIEHFDTIEQEVLYNQKTY